MSILLPLLWTILLMSWGIAGYILTWIYHDRMPKPLRYALWGVSSLVTLFWVLYHFVMFEIIGLVAMIALLTHVPMEFTSIFVGIFSALIQIKTNKKRPPKGAFSRHNGIALTLFLILPVYINPILFPERTEFADEWKDGACIQTTGSSCGAACVATMLAHYGMPEKERDIAPKIRLSERGSAAWDWGRYLRKKGLRVRVYHCPQKPETFPVPCLVGTRLGDKNGIAHVIIVMDQTSDSFTLMDPMAGFFTWTKEKTWENYYFLGFAMQVTR